MKAWLLAQQAEMEAIKAEIQGMIALNQFRIGLGHGAAYDEAPFLEKAEELRSIATCIMENR